MEFEYVWLKVLEDLVRRQRPVTVRELEADLGRSGFRLDEKRLEEGLRRLRDQGLIDTLVYAGGGEETLGSVVVTTKGERKVRGIVRL